MAGPAKSRQRLWKSLQLIAILAQLSHSRAGVAVTPSWVCGYTCLTSVCITATMQLAEFSRGISTFGAIFRPVLDLHCTNSGQARKGSSIESMLFSLPRRWAAWARTTSLWEWSSGLSERISEVSALWSVGKISSSYSEYSLATTRKENKQKQKYKTMHARPLLSMCVLMCSTHKGLPPHSLP